MMKTYFTFGLIAVLAMPAWSAEPQPRPSTGKDPSRWPFVEMLTVDTVSLDPAYTGEDPKKALVGDCNTKAGAAKATLVVRLHIRNGMLTHLSDGKACDNCIDLGTVTQKCDPHKSSCVDSDKGDILLPPSDTLKPRKPVPPDYLTRLDIPLTKSVWKKAKMQPILLKIVLEDERMKFIRRFGARRDSAIDAIRAGKDPAGMFACRQPIVSGTHESVAFRVRYPTDNVFEIGSLNIGVSVRDIVSSDGVEGFTLPIILDPKVPSSGVDMN